MTQNATLLNTKQVAEILEKSIRTVNRMAEGGDLPYIAKMPGPTGAYLFDRSEIERLRPTS